MDFQFDGFQNSIPVFWIFVLILSVFGLSIWTYRNSTGLSAGYQWLLTGLRSTTFLLLLLLLLNPVLAIHDHFSTPVRVALLLDNSQSTTIEKGDYGGADRYQEVIAALTPDGSSRFEHLQIEPYGFDSGLFKLESVSDLDFEGSRTDIERAMSEFMDRMDQEEAVVLVTDGIVTTGRDPSATASRLPIPIFTVGIGDTSRLNDIVVQRVIHNPSASLNSRITVEASILNNGFPDQDINVQLRQNDSVLDETTIRSSEQRSVQQVTFDLELDEEGLLQFQIHVPEVGGEWSTENNTRYFSVDVRDDRLRILHLAYEVHPDVRHLRSFLREDQNIFLENRTWIVEDRYVEGELPDRPDTLDLVILHGFPHPDLSTSIASEIADLFNDNALLIVGSASQDVGRLSTLFPGQLPLGFESGYSWYDVRFRMLEDMNSHAILDFEVPGDLRSPSIQGGIRNVSENANATGLLKTEYRGNDTEASLLAVRSVGNRHIAHLNGYHFFRWAQSTDQNVREFWENLINNTIKWTAASPDEELLELSPTETVYHIGEQVIMSAFLRNESGEPDENAVIDLVVSHPEADDHRNYVMSNEGGGQYQLEIGNLPEGSYSFEGVASRIEREIDSRSGQFTVGGVNREYLQTVRDDELLQFMAQTSGGRYFTHDQADNLLELLEEQLGFEERDQTTTRSLAMHRHPLWFIVIILLLTTEWAIRKYRAMA